MISSNTTDLHPRAASSMPASGPRFEDASLPRTTSPSATTPAVARRVGNALAVLVEAHDYAADLGVDVWDFAVELRELKALKLTNGDLRWLVLKGFVEQACETTLPGEERRSFRAVRGLTFTKRTCFVITPAGLDAAAAGVDREPRPAATAPIVAPAATPKVAPHWDSDLQELRINGLIVKQFKVPAPNQEMVLAAFEEENWPARIDDPLPPQIDQDPKRRLHDTIVSLNRSHKHRLIRFMGDGSGEGVRWTTVTDHVEQDDAEVK